MEVTGHPSEKIWLLRLGCFDPGSTHFGRHNNLGSAEYLTECFKKCQQKCQQISFGEDKIELNKVELSYA
jgi:hypothetical protein